MKYCSKIMEELNNLNHIYQIFLCKCLLVMVVSLICVIYCLDFSDIHFNDWICNIFSITYNVSLEPKLDYPINIWKNGNKDKNMKYDITH